MSSIDKQERYIGQVTLGNDKINAQGLNEIIRQLFGSIMHLEGRTGPIEIYDSITVDGNIVSTGSVTSESVGYYFPDGTLQTTAAISGTGYVPASRQVIAGAGLTGGGTLVADVTLNVGAGTGITVNANDVALATLSDSGAGTFLKLTRDAYGRLSGTTAVLAADITGLIGTPTLALTGTANQVLVNGGVGPATGNITLTLPQNIHTGATPQFAGLGIGVTGAANKVLVGDANYFMEWIAGAPDITFDSGDALRFTRASNLFEFFVGSTARASLDTSGLYLANLTSSSVVFAGTSGLLTQNNSGTSYFTYDNTAKTLKLQPGTTGTNRRALFIDSHLGSDGFNYIEMGLDSNLPLQHLEIDSLEYRYYNESNGASDYWFCLMDDARTAPLGLDGSEETFGFSRAFRSVGRSVSAMTGNGATVTVTCPTHGLANPTDSVRIVGVTSPSGWNGTKTTTYVNANTFTFSDATAGTATGGPIR